MDITIQTEIDSTLEKVWDAWVTPEAITKWNFASEDWCCPVATLDLNVGGRFCYRMESLDGCEGFDFEGTFTEIVPLQKIQYRIDDNRLVTIEFSNNDIGILVVETFEAEQIHSPDEQISGWQSILNNFQRHVERL